MADPTFYRPRTSDIPTQPGVYRFLDEQGRVIYVGKAKNLRNRLTSYFQDISRLRPRTQQMVLTAAAVKWVVVASEVEALTLEYSWIKEFSPRFNVVFRDDKSYPYLAVTLADEFPRAFITREAKRRGVRYYGPYAHVWAIRTSLEELLKAYPIRTCTPTVFNRAQRQGRPCLLGYIEKCCAPCVGRVDAAQHRDMAQELCRFLEGHTGQILAEQREQMNAAAAALDFERAAQHRNAIAALTTVLEKNAVVLPDNTDADIFGIEADEIEAAVQVFHVRAGRVRGVRGWVVERVNDAELSDLVGALLEQVYSDVQPNLEQRHDARSVDDIEHEAVSAIPPQIWVPAMPTNRAVIEQWLSGLRGTLVHLHTPQRGVKKDLAETVHNNAIEALRLHKSKRVSDLTQRGAALEQLQEYLALPSAPLRIECFDISHTSGTERVGSMVVFEDGAPRKSAYRRFLIRGDGFANTDDTAAMAEVLTRRLQRLIQEDAKLQQHLQERGKLPKPQTEEATGQPEVEAPVTLLSSQQDDTGMQQSGTVPEEHSDATALARDPKAFANESGPLDESGRPKRFSYRPDLLVVDGGLPQVRAAQRVVDELGLDIAVVGLAKRLEELWVPEDDFPVILPRRSPALYMLQFLRDESHRFAISHHRKRRSKKATESILDGIHGLGPKRQRDLLKHFKSVKRLRAASIEEIAEVPGIGPQLAASIFDQLQQLTKKSPGNLQ